MKEKNVYTFEQLEEMKQRKKEYMAAYQEKYRAKQKANNVKHRHKEFVKELEARYKGFDFHFKENIMQIEVKLPFRIMYKLGNCMRCDEDKIYKLQQDLRKCVSKVHQHQHLLIIDCNSIQIYLKNFDNVNEVCDVVKNKVIECIKLYGFYYKNKKQLGQEWNEIMKNGDQ